MISIIITLMSALFLAGMAGWFSIAGIVTIFAASTRAAILMGIAIEAGKLTAISWLYRNWKNGPWFKWPLLIPTFAALILTSAGIFGFLSKAHVEQGGSVINNSAKVELIEQRISREQEKITQQTTNITAHKQELQLLDGQVQKLIENNKISDPTKGAKVVREAQKPERESITAQIQKAQDQIDLSQDQIVKYKEEQLLLTQASRDYELETGPIKYIAAVVYEDPKANMDKAIRILIMMIIVSFDPLAALLLMAANYSIIQRQKQKAPIAPIIPIEPEPKLEKLPEPTPEPELSPAAPPVQSDLDEFRSRMTAIANTRAELADDANEYNSLMQSIKQPTPIVEPIVEPVVEPIVEIVDEFPPPETTPEPAPEPAPAVLHSSLDQVIPHHKLQLKQHRQPLYNSVFPPRS